MGFEGNHQLAGRHEIPYSEVDAVGSPHHPPQEKVKPLARRPLGRSRKEEANRPPGGQDSGGKECSDGKRKDLSRPTNEGRSHVTVLWREMPLKGPGEGPVFPVNLGHEMKQKPKIFGAMETVIKSLKNVGLLGRIVISDEFEGAVSQ